MQDTISGYIAQNMKALRQSRNLTQEQLARLAGIPRATWANLESGSANPTITVLARIAAALQVPLEEIISPPKAITKYYPAGSIPKRRRGGVEIRNLLPDQLPGVQLERLELPPGAKMVGTPHRLGTREYLACEMGQVELLVAGEPYQLAPGDVVVFRGDQKHSYLNRADAVAVAYSAIVIH